MTSTIFQLSSQLNNDCRFFGYKHWTCEEQPRCFYIGIGLARRPFELRNRNHKHKYVTKKYGCRIEICVGPMLRAEAAQWEIDFIVAENTYHYTNPNDIGCNFTLGGEGTSGSHHNLGKRKPPRTEAHKDALRKARAKQDMTKHAASMLGKNKGKLRPDNVSRNALHKGSKNPKISLALKGHPWSLERQARFALEQTVIVDLAKAYENGKSINELVDQFKISRYRVIKSLKISLGERYYELAELAIKFANKIGRPRCH
jgi:hypothetical protein